MKRNRLLMAGLISLVALSSLGVGVSVAWYASARELTISQIEISVKSSRNLQVSDSEDASSFVDHKYTGKDDGTYDDSSLALKSENTGDFKPVSSMYSFKEEWHSEDDTYSWMERKESNPVFTDSYSVSSSEVPIRPTKATNGYFTQEIYLLADDDVYVTLDPEACYFNGYIATSNGMELKNTYAHDAVNKKNREMAKKLHPGSSDEELDTWATKMDDIIKSLRISILVPDENDYQYVIIDPFKEKNDDGSYKDTYFAGRLNVDMNDYYDNYKFTDSDGEQRKKETIYGDIDESTRKYAKYGELVTADSSSGDTIIDDYDKSSFKALTQANTYPLDFSASLENGLKVAKEHSYALCDQGSASSDLMIPLYRGKVRKIVLSIYLEGWDTDCINNTMGANFLSILSFKIAREM
jgi:hypothetical protein